jgi:hypothetical protein
MHKSGYGFLHVQPVWLSKTAKIGVFQPVEYQRIAQHVIGRRVTTAKPVKQALPGDDRQGID